MQKSFLTRALLSAATLLVAFASAGCEQFDPVKTESLCEDRQLVSMRCPQCQKAPFEPECSICTGPAKNDPEMCKQETGNNPGTNPDGGKSGDGARADGSVGEGGAGAGSGGSSGEGGAGSGAGESGNGATSGSGAAGGSAPSLTCTDDLWCRSRTPERPACDVGNRACVPCLEDKHCSGTLAHCNTMIQRCANCIGDSDCPGRRCDMQNMVCVDCEQDADCTADPVNNNCDTHAHSCVDCVTNSGCADQPVNKTCDPTMLRCVDCLDDIDCNEAGKPACDKANRVCVGCTSNSNCTTGPNQTCDVPNRTCVDCLDDSGCSGATSRCAVEEQKCVACLTGAHCASDHCVAQTCVECEEDGDCGDPDASHCDPSSHMCVGCTANSQCGHLSATRACDTTNRRCVECNDDTTCAGKACLRAMHRCSTVNVNSLSECGACQADSMCEANMKCIAMSFGGSSYGTFCAFTQASRSQGRCANARPYTQAATVRSVDGSNQTYCVPPVNTSCPGVLDLLNPRGGKLCSGAAQCGLGMNDGQCNADMRCTYGCVGDVDCPSDLTCVPGLQCG